MTNMANSDDDQKEIAELISLTVESLAAQLESTSSPSNNHLESKRKLKID